MTGALTTASGSYVKLVNGAQWYNVFWQVGTSATLGSNSTFSETSWRYPPLRQMKAQQYTVDCWHRRTRFITQ